MKSRKPQLKHRPLRVKITNEEIMRDLLFPASQRAQRTASGSAERR